MQAADKNGPYRKWPFCTPSRSLGLYRTTPGKPARIQHAACWAHARRKLFEVHEATKSPIAEEALRRIQALYQIEAEINGKPVHERHAVRQARSTPLLADLKAWMEAQRRRSNLAILRTTPALLGLFSLVTIWADELAQAPASAVRPRTAAWYNKREPTFSDAIAAVRRALWCPSGLSMSHPSTETVKIPAALLQRLTDTLCHAA